VGDSAVGVPPMTIGAVVIGRNEGERLVTCLNSLAMSHVPVVYVDSGSSDGSVARARSLGAQTLELDPARPFSAARARNEGFVKAISEFPSIEFVQFVDGDCELIPGWITEAKEFLERSPEVAIVCGRLKERHPGASIYNRLCSMEWDAGHGESSACGGIAMVRTAAFQSLGGFRADLIAGEEPELCVRLRAVGWKVWRLDADMALHDAAMTRFGQWWRRAVRAGYAFAEGAYLHGAAPERHWVRESRRALVWGILFPFGIIVLAAMDLRWLLLFLAYPAQIVRLALTGGRAPGDNWLQAVFWVLGRFPEGVGQVKFLLNRILGRRHVLIEYK